MAERDDLLTDLRLTERHAGLRPAYAVAADERRARGAQGPYALLDVQTVAGRENLAQAILVRLLTPRGELDALGHPEYGSRLHELVGRENTETTRNLAKLYILESLAMESRVEEVVGVTVEPDPDDRTAVDITLQVRPAGPAPTLAIGPFTLEFAQ